MLKSRSLEESDGKSSVTLAISGLVIVLAAVSVALRFWTRIFTRAGLGFDDWLILTAVIATLLTAGLILWSNSISPNGNCVSEHVDEPCANKSSTYSANDVIYLKLSFVSSVLYFTIAGATKQGILLMYNRIFNANNGFRYQLYVASFLVIVWWIGCTIAAVANCIPLSRGWTNGPGDEKHCINFNIFWMASGSVEILLDCLILILPVAVVLPMSMSRRRKITVLGIFLLGGFVVITGIVRVILGYSKTNRVPNYHNAEVWTVLHAGISIVCGTLPILRPLLKRVLGSRLISRISTWRGSGSSRTVTTVVRAPGCSGPNYQRKESDEIEMVHGDEFSTHGKTQFKNNEILLIERADRSAESNVSFYEQWTADSTGQRN